MIPREHSLGVFGSPTFRKVKNLILRNVGFSMKRQGLISMGCLQGCTPSLNLITICPALSRALIPSHFATLRGPFSSQPLTL